MSNDGDLLIAHPVTEAQESLDAALTELAAIADDRRWTMSEVELLKLRRSLEATAARLTAVSLGVTREIEERGAATRVGASGTVAWLMGSLRMHPGAARQELRMAESLAGGMAATGAALASGRLSYPAAAEIDKAVRALPDGVSVSVPEEAEAFLLEQAQHLRPDHLHRLGKHLAHVLDPEQGRLVSEAEERAVEQRQLFVQRGSGDIRGRLDPVAVDGLLAAIGPLAAPRTGPEGEPDARPVARRRADALVEIVEVALRSGLLPTEGGEPPQVLVTVPWSTLAEQPDDPARGTTANAGSLAGELIDGTAVSAEAARRIACDASVIAAVFGSFGQVLDIGRAARSVPRPIRRALTARDRGCAFPGCDRPPTWCEAHHIWHWAHGGPTSLDNLVLLCGHHHRTVHHHGWVVHVGAEGLPVFTPPRWVDPDQVPITRPWRMALDQLPLAPAARRGARCVDEVLPRVRATGVQRSVTTDLTTSEVTRCSRMIRTAHARPPD